MNLSHQNYPRLLLSDWPTKRGVSVMRRLALFLTVFALPTYAQVIEPHSCVHDELYGMLDFWLGDWDVYVGDNLVGRNTIEKTMQGCAVLEHWQSTDGGRGTSLFYVNGHVRQVIEVSMDEGTNWKAVFDAEYRPTKGR
jgi:hypothetical protein